MTLLVSPSAAEGGWPDGLFASSPGRTELEAEDGTTFVVDSARWHRGPDRADRSVLARCRGPVLDIGCGPGRHVAALAEQGCPALGIDSSVAAVAAAHRRGARALRASVFSSVPNAGRWGSALLLDGNIGIGGDVPRLMERVADLVRPEGRVLVETTSPLEPPRRARIRVRHRDGVSGWFPWAWVTPADLDRHASRVGMVTDEVWHSHGRWFARLRTCATGDNRSQEDRRVG